MAGRRNGSIAHTDTRSDSPHKDKNDKSSSSSYHDNPRLRGDPLSERQRHASNNQRETGNQHLTPSRIKSSGDHKNNRLSDNKHSSTTSTPRSSSMDTSSSPGTAHERVPSRQITNGNGGCLWLLSQVSAHRSKVSRCNLACSPCECIESLISQCYRLGSGTMISKS